MAHLRMEYRTGPLPDYCLPKGPLPPRRIHDCDRYPILLFPGVTMPPQRFKDVQALAEALVAKAQRQPLDCGGRDNFVHFPGDETRRVVAVWTLMEGGSRNRFLGYVWLDGRNESHAILTEAVRAIERRHATKRAA